MSFGAPEPKGPNPLLPVQFEGDDSFTGNDSLGDSIGAIESSAASMMDSDERAAADMGALVIMPKSDKVLDDNEEVKFGRQREGKNADHYGNTTNGKTSTEKQLGLGRRGRPRVTKRGSTSASNPYEFYYYSGFGPSWGKRRGERGGGEASKNGTKEAENNSNEIVTTQKNSRTSSFSSQIDDDNEEFDFIDDEDEEEYEVNGRKRMRKPVKARSLKSLM
ncbi:hypothetical protein SLEP1_g2354 [Rubroshorea leprosula]|uniref:Uncharacterized protein n=1 Tax=Rubroshorea leprosula TaxID=152421 RepID=A0AAV5HS88_9ROSI|nr:hypothetical protein SLEP1_g2354 [Rubroshorea leprosula]